MEKTIDSDISTYIWLPFDGVFLLRLAGRTIFSDIVELKL
jgi:hypothetical protein